MKLIVDGKKNAVFMVTSRETKQVSTLQDVYRNYFDVPTFVKHWNAQGVEVEVKA